MTKSIHCMLVSAQAAPNLLPALDATLKPSLAILLVTAKMRHQADSLQKVLTETGIKVETVSLSDEHDTSKVEESILEIASRHEGADVALNLTGGTKLMALAALSVAETAGWKIFYVSVDTDEIIWLGKGAAERQKLISHLRLRPYLQAYGHSSEPAIERPLPPTRHNKLIKTLVTNVGSLEQPLGQLNYLAQQAQAQEKLEFDMTQAQSDSRKLEALLRNFEESEVLTVSGDNVKFNSAQDLEFAKGGWLEDFVFRTVSDLHAEIAWREIAKNLVVIGNSDSVKNEIDVAFMARNRLHVVECKTARMDSATHPTKANDTLFKLAEVCRRVGGLGTHGMLASYRSLRDTEKRLARALGIEIVCGTELIRLHERILKWVTHGG